MFRTVSVTAIVFLAFGLFFQVILIAEQLKKITLEEVLSIGSLDDETLFQWAGVAVDSEGNIYVTDAMDYSLKKFDPKGNFIKKAGGRGQGPGEFMAPRLLGCSGNLLYATDQKLMGFQVFDTELNFIRRVRIKIFISDLKILSDSRIAAASMAADDLPAVFIFDSEGELLQKIVYSEKKMPLLMDAVSFDFDEEGNLYLAYSFQDRVEKWSRKGKRIWSRKLLNIRKVKREKISTLVVPTEIVFKDVALDRQGYVFVLGGHFSPNRSRDIYVLHPDGRHLTTFALGDSSHCIHIDQKNFLYARANEGVTLKKFRMHYIYR